MDSGFFMLLNENLLSGNYTKFHFKNIKKRIALWLGGYCCFLGFDTYLGQGVYIWSFHSSPSVCNGFLCVLQFPAIVKIMCSMCMLD